METNACTTMSAIRRKPKVTYKSPSSTEWTASSNPAGPPHASKPIITPTTTPRISVNIRSEAFHTKRMTRPTIHPLPLYHPLGPLALSLPPLDPASFGLPLPALTALNLRGESGGRRLSARARRPAAKLREVANEEVTLHVPTVSTIAAVAAREVKERPSPRKRKPVGGKRKRKEGDDGDASYPAKRTRMPRGNNNQVADEESLTEIEQPAFEEMQKPEAIPDLVENAKHTERRSTRSSNSAKRRDSSASDTPSISTSTHGVPSTWDVNLDANTTLLERPGDCLPSQIEGNHELIADTPINQEEKEEGELSEGGQPGS